MASIRLQNFIVGHKISSVWFGNCRLTIF